MSFDANFLYQPASGSSDPEAPADLVKNITGALDVAQPLQDEGTPAAALKVRAGDHTDLSNSAYATIDFDFSGQTVNFDGGGGNFNLDVAKVIGPTITADAAQTLGRASALYVKKGTAGANVTVSANYAAFLDGLVGVSDPGDATDFVMIDPTARAFTFGALKNWSFIAGANAVATFDAAGMLMGDEAGVCIRFPEVTAPTGAASTAKLYAEDNGAGKTRLVVIFGSGAAQVLATEP